MCHATSQSWVICWIILLIMLLAILKHAACEFNMALIYIQSLVYLDLSLSFNAKGCCLSHKQIP